MTLLFDRILIKPFLKDIVFKNINIDKHGSGHVLVEKNGLRSNRKNISFITTINSKYKSDLRSNRYEQSNRRDIHTLRMDAIEQLENIWKFFWYI